MGKFIKSGRVVVLTNGRHAGKKAVVVKTFDDGTKARPFGHCLLAGVQRPPLKVTKKMSSKKVKRRCTVKPFIQYLNYNHMLPTRYTLPTEIDAKTFVTDAHMETPDQRKEAKKALAKLFAEKFASPVVQKTGKVSKDLVFLKQKLRF